MECNPNEFISREELAHDSWNVRFLIKAVLALCLCFAGLISANADAIYVIDAQGGTGGKGALLSIDSSGHRTIITDFGSNTKVGGTLKQPKGANPQYGAVEANGNVVVELPGAGTKSADALVLIDPSTGIRTLLSDFGNPAQGPTIIIPYPRGVAIAADGSIYLNIESLSECSDCNATVKVDPLTGMRTFISDWNNPEQGRTVFSLLGISPSSDGSLFVGCSTGNLLGSTFVGVDRLDPESGNRSDTTNFLDPAQGPVETDFLTPRAIVQESVNTILVIEGSHRIFRVDLITGQRTIFSDFQDPAEGFVFTSNPHFPNAQTMTLANFSGVPYLLATGIAQRRNRLGKLVDAAVVVRVDPVTGDRTLFSDLSDLTEGPTGTTSIGGIMFYATPLPPPPPPTPTPTPTPTVTSGDLISTSIFSRSLVRIDPTIGQPTVLSDFTNAGQGPTGFPWAAVINSARIAFATEGDASQAVVFAIDTATGNRRVLSNFADSSQGPIAETPRGLAIEGNGNLLVTDRSNPGSGYSPGLFEVNAVTGARTRISDFNNPALGPVGASPMGVALDASGFILVVDALAGTDCRGFGGCGALFRVDRSTGVRTMISDFGNPSQGPFGGTGPNAMAIDTDGSVLVLDNFAGTSGLGQLFRVNPTTGGRTIVTDYGDATQGTIGSISLDSGVLVANGTIFAPCTTGTCKIDPATGLRSPFTVFEGSLAVVP
jgi:hypothetical protein